MLNFKILIINLLSLFINNYCYSQTLKVNLTYYHATHNSLTADGSKINAHHLKKQRIKWCAVSRDIWNMFPTNSINKRIWIEGFGIYYVKDKMNKKWKHKVDILIHKSNKDKIENKSNITIHLIYNKAPKTNNKTTSNNDNKRTSKTRYTRYTS